MSRAPEPGQAPDPSSRLKAVAAEMAAVFDEAGLTGETAVVASLRATAVTALRPGRRGPPAAAMAAALAAGLAGLGAGALIFRPQAEPASARASIAPVARIAPPAEATAVPAAAAVLAAPAAAGPQSATSPSGPVQLAPVQPAAVGPTTVAGLEPTPRPRASAARDSARTAPRRTSRVRGAQAAARQASCTGSPAGEACREAVIRADRRLRTVYARAAREGVPTDVLVDYRERWADLREREADRPRQLIVEYRALASALQQEPRDEEERYRSRQGSPLRGLRTALLSWW